MQSIKLFDQNSVPSRGREGGCTHRCDDGMPIVLSNKVFDAAGQGDVEAVASSEVGGQVLFRGHAVDIGVAVGGGQRGVCGRHGGGLIYSLCPFCILGKEKARCVCMYVTGWHARTPTALLAHCGHMGESQLRKRKRKWYASERRREKERENES